MGVAIDYSKLTIEQYLQHAHVVTKLQSWPITSKDGMISIPEEHNGKNLSTLLERAKDVQDYINTLNKRTQEIATSTERTSTPTLVMGEAIAGKPFLQRLHWHALKSQLEASGAHVDAIKTQEPYLLWPRDRFIASENGHVYPGSRFDYDEKVRIGNDGEDFAQKQRTTRDERQKAQAHLKTHMQAQGISGDSTEFFIEGGDILQHHKSKTVFIGVYTENGKPRELHQKAAEEVAKKLGMKLVLVPKTQNPPFYHL